jgi:hypothetical protein
VHRIPEGKGLGFCGSILDRGKITKKRRLENRQSDLEAAKKEMAAGVLYVCLGMRDPEAESDQIVS